MHMITNTLSGKNKPTKVFTNYALHRIDGSSEIMYIIKTNFAKAKSKM